MRRATVDYDDGFRVLVGNWRSQAASMVIPAGRSEGGPHNRHRGSDQWLYVESGVGEAVVNGHTYPIKSGALLLIEQDDLHEIRNTGREPMRTLNIYLPPAYTADGEGLPGGLT